MEIKDLKNRFIFPVSKTVTMMQKMESLNKNAFYMANLINDYCPDGREKSLAITKLEEVLMWAEKAIRENAE